MPDVFNIECHRLHYRPANTAFSAGYVSWLCPFQFTDQICTCQIVIHSSQITSTSYIISPSYDHSRVPTSPTYSSTSPLPYIHTSHCHSMIVAVAYTQLIVAWIFPPQPPHHLAYRHPDIYSPYHHSAPCHTYVMSPFYDCGHTYTQLHHLDIHLLDLSALSPWVFSY